MATNAPQKLSMRSDFRITYYSKKDDKFISRLGKWGEKSRIYISKSGKKCFCYYQLSDGEAEEGYRTAVGVWDIELTKFGNSTRATIIPGQKKRRGGRYERPNDQNDRSLTEIALPSFCRFGHLVNRFSRVWSSLGLHPGDVVVYLLILLSIWSIGQLTWCMLFWDGE